MASPSTPPADPHRDVPFGFEPFHADSGTFIGLCGPMYAKEVPGGAPIMPPPRAA